jgi:ABC-type nitrate/sulfonate/bicarbonate transport system substrate-binding protein
MSVAPITRRLAGTLGLASLAVGGRVQGQQAEKIRAAFIPTVSFLPLWIAKEKGIFAAHGLDVTLTPIQNITLLPGAAGRQFEIIPCTPPDFLKAVAGGINLAAFAGLVVDASDNPITKVVATKASGITNVHQLVGKTVAAPSIGAVSNVGFLYWLKKNGIDPKSVRVVEVPYPNMGDQLQSGRVDAIQSIQPFLGKQLAEGNVAVGSHLLVVQDPALFVFWGADADWVRSHGATLARWDAAMEEGRRTAIADGPEVRAILAKYTGLPQPVAEKIPLPTYRFTLDPRDLGVWADVLRDLGQLDGPVDAAKVVLTTR